MPGIFLRTGDVVENIKDFIPTLVKVLFQQFFIFYNFLTSAQTWEGMTNSYKLLTRQRSDIRCAYINTLISA